MIVKKKQIYEFAVKWLDKFKDKNINYLELIEGDFPDDCNALGFQMDSGIAFKEKYGNVFFDCDALRRIIDDIDDIPLLGSAIYSLWRYYNHWAYSGAEILEEKNRTWFILALDRLKVLSVDDDYS